MRKLGIILLILLLGGFTNEILAQKKGRAVVCFQSNMDCSNCEQTLYEHLKFEKGVKDLKVDHVSNTIFIEYQENKNDEKGFAQAIEKKGYKAEVIDKEKFDQLTQQKKTPGDKNSQEENHGHN